MATQRDRWALAEPGAATVTSATTNRTVDAVQFVLRPR